MPLLGQYAANAKHSRRSISGTLATMLGDHRLQAIQLLRGQALAAQQTLHELICGAVEDAIEKADGALVAREAGRIDEGAALDGMPHQALFFHKTKQSLDGVVGQLLSYGEPAKDGADARRPVFPEDL